MTYVSVTFQLCILKTVRMHVKFMFLSDKSFIPDSSWDTNRQPLHDLSRGVIDVPVMFKLCILKTVRTANAGRIYAFWVINPLLLTPLRVR